MAGIQSENSKRLNLLLKLFDSAKLHGQTLIIERLSDSQAALLSRELRDAPVTSLVISNNRLSRDGIEALGSILRRGQITTVSISNSAFDDFFTQVLVMELSGTAVTDLDLSRNCITNLDLIAPLLASTQIATLNLSSNRISQADIRQLIKIIPATQLTDITLEGIKDISPQLTEQLLLSLSRKVPGHDLVDKTTSTWVKRTELETAPNLNGSERLS